MIAVIQRVKSASVKVEDRVVGKINNGLLVLLGVHQQDTRDEVDWVARKTVHLRIFPDSSNRMNKSLLDTGGELLVVSQFTLYGNTAKGNRPSFIESAPPEKARALYEQFIEKAGALVGRTVQTGEFGAAMDVALINDGPVTLIVEKQFPE